MKTHHGTFGALALLALPVLAQTPPPKADLAAGKTRVEAVCAACHGANGVSVADNIPNLAGQRVPYLETQLRALKSGVRKNAVMGPMAAQLSSDDIVNVAAYFGSLQPAYAAEKSAQLPALSKTNVAFPENYKSTFTMYQTVNRSDISQVRFLWANPPALQAAREGQPMPPGAVLLLEQHAAKLDAEKKLLTGSDGFYVADRLVGFTVHGHRRWLGRCVSRDAAQRRLELRRLQPRHEAARRGQPGRVPGLPQAARQDQLCVLARAADEDG